MYYVISRFLLFSYQVAVDLKGTYRHGHGSLTECDIDIFGLLVITVNWLMPIGDNGVVMQHSHHYKTLQVTVSYFTSLCLVFS